jgi:nicotianamine synthase
MKRLDEWIPGDLAVSRKAQGRLHGLVCALEGSDLEPSAMVNKLFHMLVDLALLLPAKHVAGLDPSLIERSRQVCAEGEARLEAHWAQGLSSGDASLPEFPYLSNYTKLVDWEYQLLERLLLKRAPDSAAKRVVFAGCGPLPLTALLLGRAAPELQLTCFDRDPTAVQAARQVCAQLGPELLIRFEVADALTYNYSSADLVIAAALIGDSTATHTRLLSRVGETAGPDALVAVRTVAADGRQLLYRRVCLTSVPPSLAVVGEYHPPPEVVNSLLVLRPR